jgi:hypothetical protein
MAPGAHTWSVRLMGELKYAWRCSYMAPKAYMIVEAHIRAHICTARLIHELIYGPRGSFTRLMYG